MKSAWIDFDTPKKPGLWISYIAGKLINKQFSMLSIDVAITSTFIRKSSFIT